MIAISVGMIRFATVCTDQFWNESQFFSHFSPHTMLYHGRLYISNFILLFSAFRTQGTLDSVLTNLPRNISHGDILVTELRMGIVVISSKLRKVFRKQMLDSEVSALKEVLLALCSVSSFPPAHAPTETSHLCTILKKELYSFIALHLISNVYVSSG
jgi:hypothetical protein